MTRIRAIGAFLLVVAAVATGGCTKDAENSPAAAETAAPGTRAIVKNQFDTLVIPGGTAVVASLDAPLSTDTNHSGDPFTATTIEGRARMTLLYQSIVDPQGKRYGISALPLTLEAASAARGDVEKIAAGAVLGAIVGAIAKGGKGAAVGAGVGAGAGTIVVLATQGDDVELSAGQRLSVLMTGATSVQVAAR